MHALEPPLRERVHAFVRRNPGAHILEMATEFRVAHPTVMYHLARLADEGYVLSMPWGRRRVHFDAQAHFTAWERALLAALAEEEPRALLALAAAREGLDVDGAAIAPGLTGAAVRRHASELRRLRALRPAPRLGFTDGARGRARALLAKLPPDARQAACLTAVGGDGGA